jgi:ribose/xylose/arabinose/galactoside ABC-type transport system permease subunit
LDDPTRGVDIATKQDFYRLCRQLAREGRTLIWHTTEDAELLACDRVLVFAKGQIVRELSGPQITEETIVAASFSSLETSGPRNDDQAIVSSFASRLARAAPFIGLALVLAVMIAINPSVASVFGIDLLLMPALSLVLVTEAQMFVVGGSEIDLGVGAFAGLISVLSATWLYDRALLGLPAIIAALAAYAMIGAVIQGRKIPAIVVTLGASFIWAGIGYSIQPTPGGASPEWLTAMANWSISPYVPTSVVLIAAVALFGALLDRSPLGVILRGFGSNPAAMVASGWPPIRFAVVRYLIAGAFAAAAGLSLTAINASSDINSGNSYTLLSVAAVVMGGCALTGGIVAPLGAVIGAVTLALIGALLGALGSTAILTRQPKARCSLCFSRCAILRGTRRNDGAQQGHELGAHASVDLVGAGGAASLGRSLHGDQSVQCREPIWHLPVCVVLDYGRHRTDVCCDDRSRQYRPFDSFGRHAERLYRSAHGARPRRESYAWCICGAGRGIGRRLVQRRAGRSSQGSSNNRDPRDGLRSRNGNAPGEPIHSRLYGKPHS